MSKEAMRLALEALQFALHVGFDESSESQIKKGDKAVQQHQKAITALREALAEQPAQQDPVIWAISYDGKTPYAIWPDGDGALLDLEIKRQGGTASKMPLYASPQPAQQEPVAAECNFVGTKEWGRCSIEHHNLVQSEPHKWPRYQTRLLYTSPQPAQQDPVALKWQRAPIRTAWGDDMVVASVAIDKDHTVCLYCERDQTPKVDAMLAQRTWVYLTDEERNKLWREVVGWGDPSHDDEDLMKAIEDASRRKNT